MALLILCAAGCHERDKEQLSNTNDWSNRSVSPSKLDELEYGKSYLSVYSKIFSASEHRTHALTTMISLRNTSGVDTIYLLSAKFYNTYGSLVKEYFKGPVYLAPMETSEIIINEADKSGDTGSNFIFEWKIPRDCPEPLFEGIMSSTAGQQGLSFTTQAIRIK